MRANGIPSNDCRFDKSAADAGLVRSMVGDGSDGDAVKEALRKHSAHVHVAHVGVA